MKGSRVVLGDGFEQRFSPWGSSSRGWDGGDGGCGCGGGGGLALKSRRSQPNFNLTINFSGILLSATTAPRASLKPKVCHYIVSQYGTLRLTWFWSGIQITTN